MTRYNIKRWRNEIFYFVVSVSQAYSVAKKKTLAESIVCGSQNYEASFNWRILFLKTDLNVVFYVSVEAMFDNRI